MVVLFKYGSHRLAHTLPATLPNPKPNAHRLKRLRKKFVVFEWLCACLPRSLPVTLCSVIMQMTDMVYRNRSGLWRRRKKGCYCAITLIRVRSHKNEGEAIFPERKSINGKHLNKLFKAILYVLMRSLPLPIWFASVLTPFAGSLR